VPFIDFLTIDQRITVGVPVACIETVVLCRVRRGEGRDFLHVGQPIIVGIVAGGIFDLVHHFNGAGLIDVSATSEVENEIDDHIGGILTTG
jgi:hypothetical protein